MQGRYREDELVSNRATLLLSGGAEADRLAWATEAAANFPDEGPLLVVQTPDELARALERTRGVVYVADVLALGLDAQGQLLQVLQREERPKFVLGLSTSPAEASARGLLRDDLAYRLQVAQVDLSTAGLREAIRARRAQAQARPARRQSSSGRAAPSRKPSKAPAKKKARRR